jgi:hypothetical protein
LFALVLVSFLFPAMESRGADGGGGSTKREWTDADRWRAEQAARDREAARLAREKRLAEAKKRAEARKAEQGFVLKEWSLTGVIQGKGANLQFVPEKGGGDVTKDIAAITIRAKDVETLEALFNQPVAGLTGKKVEVVFLGKPRRSGARLLFSAMSGDIREWISARVLEEVKAVAKDAKP